MKNKYPPIDEMETGQLICYRCSKKLAPFTIEQIAGLSQLRAGNVLVTKIEARCLHCGKEFSWNLREKDVEKMTITYQQVLENIKNYNSE